MSAPRTLVVDCYLDEVGGGRNVVPHLPGARVLRAAHEAFPAVLDAEAIVVTGSAASVVDSAPWIDALERALLGAVERGAAVLGLCFGHQLLARALFGTAAVRRSPTPELGWEPIRVLAARGPLADLPPEFTCFVSHTDEVRADCREFARGCEVMAESSDCAVQAFAVRGRPLWGVQFHAEMGLEESRELVESRLGQQPELAREVLAGADRDPGLAPAILARFAALAEEHARNRGPAPR